jgi:hypothetical protein
MDVRFGSEGKGAPASQVYVSSHAGDGNRDNGIGGADSRRGSGLLVAKTVPKRNATGGQPQQSTDSDLTC